MYLKDGDVKSSLHTKPTDSLFRTSSRLAATPCTLSNVFLKNKLTSSDKIFEKDVSNPICEFSSFNAICSWIVRWQTRKNNPRKWKFFILQCKKRQDLATTHHPVLGEKSRYSLCNYSTDTDRLDIHITGALTEYYVTCLSHRQLHLSYQ